MSTIRLAAVAACLATAACSHVVNEDRYPTRSVVLELSKCASKLRALRLIESGLFKAGFVREHARARSPVAFELVENLVSGEPRLVEFRKSDFEPEKGKSTPYREIINRYRIAACEEPAGKLYLMVVRHDPVPGDQFLGKRFSEALERAECERVKPVAAPRTLGLYRETTEEDLLRYVRRQRCRDYAEGR